MVLRTAKSPLYLGPDHLSEKTAGSAWALDAMREAFMSRSAEAPRPDLFETCEWLALDRYTAARTYANALALSLGQGLGRTPDFNVPGERRTSFDEAWLLRLVERSCVQDAESTAFLVSSRIAHPYRTSIAFLVNGLSARLGDQGMNADPP